MFSLEVVTLITVEALIGGAAPEPPAEWNSHWRAQRPKEVLGDLLKLI